MFGPVVSRREKQRGRQQTEPQPAFLRGERKLEVKVKEIKLHLIVIMKGFGWEREAAVSRAEVRDDGMSPVRLQSNHL